MFREPGPHHDQRAGGALGPDHAARQLAPGAAALCVHSADRSRRHLTQPSGPDPDHEVRPGPPGAGTSCRRSDGGSSFRPPAASRLERPACRSRRLRYAERVQRRLCLERLRGAEGLRLRVAEQARPELPTHDVGRSAGLPAEPCVHHFRALVRERPGQVVH